MKTLTLHIEDELAARLETLAHETERTKSHYARIAIQQFLDDQEDYLLSIAVLERKESTVSLADLEQRVGLYDEGFQRR